MHALFDKSTATNQWKVASRILREYIEYFGPRTEQLDIVSKNGKAIFTSFTEKIMNGKEILKQPLETAISIHVEDFDSFNFTEDMHIVISVKDFKAIVTHAETLRATIIANFSKPSRPLQFAYDVPGIHSEFTLMTTGDHRGSDAPSTPSTVAMRSFSRQTSQQPPPAQATPLIARTTDMPPPNKPITSITSQLQRKPLAALKRGMPLSSQQSQDPDSLFVPMGDEDDRRWDPPDYEGEDAGDTLLWDASGETVSDVVSTNQILDADFCRILVSSQVCRPQTAMPKRAMSSTSLSVSMSRRHWRLLKGSRKCKACLIDEDTSMYMPQSPSTTMNDVAQPALSMTT